MSDWPTGRRRGELREAHRALGLRVRLVGAAMKANHQRPTTRRSILSAKRLAAVLGGTAAALILSSGIDPRSSVGPEPPQTGAKSEVGQVTVYDTVPAHLWNRLHSALFVRTAVDGRTYGQDELDPLLWPRSQYLVAGERHKRVVALLDEFLATDGHRLVTDAVKRVVLQHDLWAVFDWLANPNNPFLYREDDPPPAARALQLRLARAIRRLALPRNEIRRLPDNYAAAIAAKAFPPDHDPKKPEQAFLPADLFDVAGPWVLLGEHMVPAAPAHVRAAQGRSAFFVLLNLPAGRAATLAYLDRLGAFPNPLMPRPADRNTKVLAKNLPRFRPDLPQFPVGTRVALVRERLAIDDRGKIQPTGLIESAQFRVYREIPACDPAHAEGFDDLVGKQDAYEFRVRRTDLFAGSAGGLRAVGPQDEEMLAFLNPGPEDPFEADPPARPRGFRTLAQCAGCHGHPGVHSVEAYRRSFNRLTQPGHLREFDRSQQERAAMGRKWESFSWGLLQGLSERE
jgi:hypothetical protein